MKIKLIAFAFISYFMSVSDFAYSESYPPDTLPKAPLSLYIPEFSKARVPRFPIPTEPHFIITFPSSMISESGNHLSYKPIENDVNRTETSYEPYERLNAYRECVSAQVSMLDESGQSKTSWIEAQSYCMNQSGR